MSNSGDENGSDSRSVLAHQLGFSMDSSPRLWFNALHGDIVEGLGDELAILVKGNCGYSITANALRSLLAHPLHKHVKGITGKFREISHNAHIIAKPT